MILITPRDIRSSLAIHWSTLRCSLSSWLYSVLPDCLCCSAETACSLSLSPYAPMLLLSGPREPPAALCQLVMCQPAMMEQPPSHSDTVCLEIMLPATLLLCCLLNIKMCAKPKYFMRSYLWSTSPLFTSVTTQQRSDWLASGCVPAALNDYITWSASTASY